MMHSKQIKNAVFNPSATRQYQFTVAVISALCASFNSFSYADDARSLMLEEVMVTAQRRQESLQDAPLSVSAATGDELHSRVMADVNEIAAITPGVSIGQQYGQNRTFIRGIGLSSFSLGADASTAFHVDGVYVGRPSAQLSSFYDLNRIEVVRGPQGTLYGRNATAGSINLITNQPTEAFSGNLELGFGNFDAQTISGALSGPLTDSGKLLGRLAFRSLARDGYGTNEFNGQDIDDANADSARVILSYLPTDDLSIGLNVYYHQENDRNYAAHLLGAFRDDVPLTGVLFGGNTPSNPRDINSDVDVVNDRKDKGGALTVAWQGDVIDLKSITGYRKFERFNLHDIDGTSADAGGGTNWTERAEQVSQEFQLNLTAEQYRGVMGLYYYDEEVEGRTLLDLSALAFPGATFDENGMVDTQAWAAFAEFNIALSSNLELVTGIRYSSEKRESEGVFTIFGSELPTSGAKTWTATTPKIGLNYTLAENTLLYMSATKGFKSGLFNIGSVNPAIDPEYIWAYEAGAKTSLLNSRLELSAAIFYYDYSDLQVGRVENNQLVTVNAASAENKGFEISARGLVSSSVEVYTDISVLSAKFDDFVTTDVSRPELGELDLSGNYLPNAPKTSINYGVIYTPDLPAAGSLKVRLDGQWTDTVYFTEFNVEQMKQEDVAKLNASLSYESIDTNWRVTAFVKNLTDKKITSNTIIASSLFGYSKIGYLEPPRTYGLSVSYNW